MIVLKQNEILTNTIKVLQEHMSLNHDTNKLKGFHQISINNDSKNYKGRDGSNTNAGSSNPRVTFHGHVNPKLEYQGITKKGIQAIITQQMQIAGGGYTLLPVRSYGHPYPIIYNLEEYPKGYVIPKFRVFSGEGNRDLNPEQYLAHFIASCGNTGGNDALLLR